MADNKEELDMIERAHVAAERQEKANKVKEELVKKMEELEQKAEVRRMVGGESYAGAPPPRELTQEEKDKIGMKNYFKGTAIEKALR
jgi:hypothetical protein